MDKAKIDVWMERNLESLDKYNGTYGPNTYGLTYTDQEGEVMYVEEASLSKVIKAAMEGKGFRLDDVEEV